MLENPLATLEALVEGIQKLPQLPELIATYLETIEGNEEEKAAEIAELLLGEVFAFALPNKLVLLDNLANLPKVKKALAIVAEEGKLNFSQQKSINSLRRQIADHKKKLAEYIKNPDAYDNKGFLKNATPELRTKIINGRTRELEKQIRAFERHIESIKNATESVSEKLSKQK